MPKDLHEKALKLGASNFGYSDVKGKRYFVIYNGKKINFGNKGSSTFYDHHDEQKRDAWIKRHSKIRNKQGEFVMMKKESPSFWSRNLLWE